MKRVCRERGLPVVEYVAFTARQHRRRMRVPFDFPVFVKPANLGSSVGISQGAQPRRTGRRPCALAAEFDRKIIVERGIIGREFECSVLGNDRPEAAIPCEILPSKEFYDYEDKYLLNQARTELPANLSPEQTAELRRLAVECYRAVECEGMGRVDFLLENSTGKLYINEINTIPGFTSISMYPKMWEHAGLAYPKAAGPPDRTRAGTPQGQAGHPLHPVKTAKHWATNEHE